MKSKLKVNKSRRSSKLVYSKILKSFRKSKRITSKKSKLLNIIRGGVRGKKGKGKGKTEEPKKGEPSVARGTNVVSKKKKQGKKKEVARGTNVASKKEEGVSKKKQVKKKVASGPSRANSGARGDNNGSSGGNNRAREGNNGSIRTNSGAEKYVYFISSNLEEGEEEYRPKFVYQFDPPPDDEKDEYLGSGKIQKIFGKNNEGLLINPTKKVYFDKSIFLRINYGGTNFFYIANYEEIRPLIRKLRLKKMDDTGFWDYHIGQLNKSRYKQIYHINVPRSIPTNRNFNHTLRGNKVNESPNRPAGQQSNRDKELMAKMLQRTEGERNEVRIAQQRRAEEKTAAAKEAIERGTLNVYTGRRESINDYFKKILRKVLEGNKFEFKQTKKDGSFKFLPSRQVPVYGNRTMSLLFNSFDTSTANFNPWNNLNMLLNDLRSFRSKDLINAQIRSYTYTIDKADVVTLYFIIEGFVPKVNDSAATLLNRGDPVKTLKINMKTITSSFKKLFSIDTINNIITNYDFTQQYQFIGIEKLKNESGGPIFGYEQDGIPKDITDPELIKIMLNFVAFNSILRALRLFRPEPIILKFEQNDKIGMNFNYMYHSSSIFRNIERINDMNHNHIGLISKPYISDLKSKSGGFVDEKFNFLKTEYDYKDLSIQPMFNIDNDAFNIDSDFDNLIGNLVIKVKCNIRPKMDFKDINLEFKFLLLEILGRYNQLLTEETKKQILKYTGQIEELEFLQDLMNIISLANSIKKYHYILVKEPELVPEGERIGIGFLFSINKLKIKHEHENVYYGELNNKISVLNIFKSKIYGKEKSKHNMPIDFYKYILELLKNIKIMLTKGSYGTNYTLNNLSAGNNTIFKSIYDLIDDPKTDEDLKAQLTRLNTEGTLVENYLKPIDNYIRLFENIENGVKTILFKELKTGTNRSSLKKLGMSKIMKTVKKFHKLINNGTEFHEDTIKEYLESLTLDQLNREYRKASIIYHPDKHQDESVKERMEILFRELKTFKTEIELYLKSPNKLIYPVQYSYYKFKDFDLTRHENLAKSVNERHKLIANPQLMLQGRNTTTNDMQLRTLNNTLQQSINNTRHSITAGSLPFKGEIARLRDQVRFENDQNLTDSFHSETGNITKFINILLEDGNINKKVVEKVIQDLLKLIKKGRNQDEKERVLRPLLRVLIDYLNYLNKYNAETFNTMVLNNNIIRELGGFSFRSEDDSLFKEIQEEITRYEEERRREEEEERRREEEAERRRRDEVERLAAAEAAGKQTTEVNSTNQSEGWNDW